VILIAVVAGVQTIPISSTSQFSFLKYVGQGSQTSNTSNLSITLNKIATSVFQVLEFQI